MSISQKNDSIFSINVALTINVRDSITDIGFLKRDKSLFLVRGINPNNLFFITNIKRTWMYKKKLGKKISTLTPRELVEGQSPIWYFEYCNNELNLIGTNNCSKMN